MLKKALLLAMLLATTPSWGKIPIDRMVAAVNKEAITDKELEQELALLLTRNRQNSNELPLHDTLRQQVLEKMILKKLQLQLAKEYAISIDEQLFKDVLQDNVAAEGFKNLKEMQDFYEQNNINFASYKKYLREELIVTKLQQQFLLPHLHVSKQEKEAMLNSPLAIKLDNQQVEYKIGHILLSYPEGANKEAKAKIAQEAQAIIAKLNQGADFAKIAQEKSQGVQAAKGGDLGWRKYQELPTLFAAIVPQLATNAIYGPINDKNGIHIIKLLDKNAPHTLPANKQEKASNLVLQRKFEEHLNKWLQKIRQEANVEIFN